MVATFNGNPRTTIVSCYSPTNVSEENEIVTFYDELSSLVRSIPKHNMLVIGGDMNAQIGKNGNNKYSLHNTSNRNGQHLTDFMIENRLACLNTNYQKREGKLWTYTYANNTKAQIDYVLINKKWKNSALNCEAYSSFEGVSTDHRIVTAKIRLSLRKNDKRTATTKQYDWALLNNKDVRDKYVLELRNRFETLQEKTEKSTPNDEYENFVNAHLEAAAKYIPTKIKTKYRVPWETLAVREKRALVKTASKNYRKNPTNTNALKLKTAQYQLAGIYIKEQTEYIQNQLDKIRDSVEDRQSRIAWQTINEVSRRKNTAKAKLKAANQQERIKLWKQHFENLLGNPPKITHEPITRIISKQLDIKLGPFTQEELDSVLRKIKNRKAAGLDEIPPEVWKTRQFDDILLRHCNAVYNQNPIDRWTKGCILPFPKKGELGLAKNYRGITVTSIAAKIYNALLRNRIEPKILLLCHSKTDARFMQEGPKAVWSIPYFSVALFLSLKQNFFAYPSSKVSSCPDCIYEIHHLWQSGFSRLYSNSCCSCSFEQKLIKISQSFHKLYINNILDFQESTTILNACTKKKSGNLLNARRMSVCARVCVRACTIRVYIYIYIYVYIYIHIYIYIYICICV